ncbi:MAG: response regulator transcription factor [Phycisphaerales bacterium]
MSDRRVLIVEDEADIAELIRFHVGREGYDAEVIASGQIALNEIRRNRPDLVILDLMLPDLDGLEVCRRTKWDPETRDTPILIVSAKGEETDIVTGLELGADDYVTKPFSPRVLMARMRNILRREKAPAPSSNGAAGESRLSFGDGRLVIDSDQHEVLVDQERIDLTATEFGILEYLASRPGFVRTRDQIIAAVRGDHVVLSSRTVDVHMTALRRKLGDLGGWLMTVRGVGYRFRNPSDDGAA